MSALGVEGLLIVMDIVIVMDIDVATVDVGGCRRMPQPETCCLAVARLEDGECPFPFPSNCWAAAVGIDS